MCENELTTCQKEARANMIARAADVWGLDYAGLSDGLYPGKDEEFGRRRLCPQDLGLGSWISWTSSQPERVTRIVETTVPPDAFIIIYGIRQGFVDGVGPTPVIRGVQLITYGITLPYQPLDQRVAPSGYSTTPFEMPIELSPKATLSMDAFYHNPLFPEHADNLWLGNNFYLEIIGEVIAKRQYLLKNFAGGDNNG